MSMMTNIKRGLWFWVPLVSVMSGVKLLYDFDLVAHLLLLLPHSDHMPITLLPWKHHVLTGLIIFLLLYVTGYMMSQYYNRVFERALHRRVEASRVSVTQKWRQFGRAPHIAQDDYDPLLSSSLSAITAQVLSPAFKKSIQTMVAKTVAERLSTGLGDKSAKVSASQELLI